MRWWGDVRRVYVFINRQQAYRLIPAREAAFDIAMSLTPFMRLPSLGALGVAELGEAAVLGGAGGGGLLGGPSMIYVVV